MKKLLFLFGGILLFSAVIVSCEEEELEEEIEENLENEEVAGDARDRFVGEWNVSDSSKLHGPRNYAITMEKDSAYPDRVNIYNFYLFGDGDSVRANISSVLVNTITIPNQTANNSQISGTGELSEDDSTINLEFTVDDGNDVDEVTAVLVR